MDFSLSKALAGDVTLSLEGIDIMCRQSDGYVNATALCAAGGKSFKHWNENKKSKEFLEELSMALDVPGGDVIRLDMSYKTRATWVHPQVAIAIAHWISPKFSVRVTAWISSLSCRVYDQIDRIEALERTVADISDKVRLNDEFEAMTRELESLRALLEAKEKETVNRGEIYTIECTSCNCIYVGSSTDSERRFQEHLRDFMAKDSFAAHMRMHGSASMKLSTVEVVSYRERSDLLVHEQTKLDATIALVGRDRVINKNNPVRKRR